MPLHSSMDDVRSWKVSMTPEAMFSIVGTVIGIGIVVGIAFYIWSLVGN